MGWGATEGAEGGLQLLGGGCEGSQLAVQWRLTTVHAQWVEWMMGVGGFSFSTLTHTHIFSKHCIISITTIILQ